MAAIWNKLIGSLLSAPTRAFIDKMPELLIKGGTTDAKEEFYAWRALTAHFLSKSYKNPASWSKGAPTREQFLDDVSSLLLDHSVNNDIDDVGDGLDDVAEHAFKLATAMATSRAYWVCSMRDPQGGKELHGFKIKKERMYDVDLWDEEDGHGKSKIVDLVKTPMLLKFGNSDGENYDQCRVIKKAEVVMKARNTAA